MARRAPVIAKKVKKPRVTRNEAYIINRKYLGDEPVFEGTLTESEYIKALNWYTSMCTRDEAREYIEEFLKAKKRTDDLKKFKSIPDTRVNLTAAWQARLINRGYKLPNESNYAFFSQKLQEMLSYARKEEHKEEKIVISIQDRIREKTQDIIGDIEALIDSGEDFSLYDYLKKNEVPAQYATSVQAFYCEWLAELIEAYEGKDAQLKEAYSYMTKKQLKDRIVFINNIISDADKICSNTSDVGCLFMKFKSKFELFHRSLVQSI